MFHAQPRLLVSTERRVQRVALALVDPYVAGVDAVATAGLVKVIPRRRSSQTRGFAARGVTREIARGMICTRPYCSSCRCALISRVESPREYKGQDLSSNPQRTGRWRFLRPRARGSLVLKRPLRPVAGSVDCTSPVARIRRNSLRGWCRMRWLQNDRVSRGGKLGGTLPAGSWRKWRLIANISVSSTSIAVAEIRGSAGTVKDHVDLGRLG